MRPSSTPDPGDMATSLSPSPSPRRRVLVIAEAANPEWVSVPLVGWSLYAALREVADVHLVTQIRNRDAILRAGLQEGADFTAIDSEAIERPFWKLAGVLRMGQGKGWTMTTALSALSYPYFERLVWARFRRDLEAGRFDLVHRITPLSPTVVSPIAGRCRAAGVPFVVGPLNGGVPWPPGFDRERRREREWLSYVRGAYKAMPGRARMLAASSAIIVGSRHTRTEIPARHQARVVYLPENAVNPGRFNKRAAQRTDGVLRGCFVGRLVPYKGPDMLIEAAAPLLRDGRLRLDIVGDGPMRPDLAALAQRLDVVGAVTFHGNVPHQAVQEILCENNILTFPSVREFGGGVVLEAMALGVVPVIVDYAGPGELVTADTGFKVPIGTRAEIVLALRRRLEALAADPSALPAMGQRGIDEVARAFTWAAKARTVAEIYEDVLRRRTP